METQEAAVTTLVVADVSGDMPAAVEPQNAGAEQMTSSTTEQKHSGGFRDADGRPHMVEGGAEYDNWRRTGWSLRAEFEKNEGGIAWQAAKWLVDGYRTFLGPNASNQQKGDLITDAMRQSGLSRSTLITYIRVGLAFPNGPYVPELGFAHHRAVILIRDPGDRTYWLRQAAKKQMSVSDLKKAIIALVPSNPKLGVNAEQAAKRYTTKLQNLNPKNNLWRGIIESIEAGRSLEDYRQLYREMKMSADVLFLNFKQLDNALAGRISVDQGEQLQIKPAELVEAERLEAIGAAISEAA
jgi:hypothetical protein